MDVLGKIRMWLMEVWAELNKVTWPKKEDLVGSTVIVIIFVAFFALYLGVVDTSFASGLQFLFERA